MHPMIILVDLLMAPPEYSRLILNLMIIIDNLSTFSNVFEGCSVDMIRDNLNTINISRRCPDHSYTEDAENWTWDDFLKFRESITWLENILKDYE